MSTPTPPSITAYWQQLRKPLELEVAHGCPDTAIAGASIGTYARLWAQRLQGAGEDDSHLALSIARGLRDYGAMPPVERKRRAMAAIDLLLKREEAAKPAPPPKRAVRQPAAPERKVSKSRETALALPTGHELFEMPLEQLSPRAKWPKLLAMKLGIYTVRDLLYHIPRDWVEISRIDDLADGARAAVVGEVTRREYDRLHSKTAPQPLYKYTLTVTDDSGEAWISSITMESERARGGKSWSPNKLQYRPGQRIFVLGKVDRTGKIIEVMMEDIFELTGMEAAELRPGAKVPIYPLTNGVYQNQVHRAVLKILAALGTNESTNAVIDPLPHDIREQYGLLPLIETLQQLHRPSSPASHEQARQRLAFEEFLIPQLVLAQRHWEMRHTWKSPAFICGLSLPDMVADLAPFDPTPAQIRVLQEIEEDLRSPRPMNRLLQGDVGSGKTLVAAGALAFTVRCGMQAAIMAPTEILAEQLFLVLSRLLKPLGIAPVLLTGSKSTADRRSALAAVASGAAPVAVGTHALIQEGVAFKNLGLSIVDEQHRFGVRQRAILRGKGQAPNALIMTATPIPRTLALTAYGDLDVSVLDGMPPGRHPVETRWSSIHDLPEAYRFIRGQVSEGRQAYVLCPLVEESDLLQADAAVEMAEKLKHVFPDLRIGLLHGRKRPEEKDVAMEAFRNGTTHILACTTVVEVGVDVPNATVMLIHNAERFGLAQLHQLRGRVGRSEHKSYCLLVTHPRLDPFGKNLEELPARKRLRTMCELQDGFAISEADLELRGPGEYLGTRQSGLLDYQIGNLLQDAKYLEEARAAAQAIIADDPRLANPAYADLRGRVQRMKARLDQFRE